MNNIKINVEKDSILNCICFFLGKLAYAQFVFPKAIEREHPRLISSKISKEYILKKIETSDDIKLSYEAIKSKISKYVIQYKTEQNGCLHVFKCLGKVMQLVCLLLVPTIRSYSMFYRPERLCYRI